MRTTLITALALVLPALAAAAPDTNTDTCTRIAADIERADKARKEAIDKGDNAWKTVLPFVVIARKISSKVAADEASKQLTDLRQQAEREGCDAR